MSVSFYSYIEGPDGKVHFLEPRLNLSNATLFLRWLDLPCEPSGSHDVHDLKSRCLLALAVGGTFLDDGMPTLESGGPGTGMCRMVDVGIRPDYLRDRAALLIEVCDAAIEAGLDEVLWA